MTDRRIRIILDKTQAEKGAKELDQAVTGVGRAADGAQFSVNKLAAAIGAIVSTQQIISFLKNATTVSAEFEQAMAAVGAVSRATDDELAALTATARHYGAITEFSATQAASGLEYLARAGFTAEQSIAALPAVLDLATSANMDLGKAADVTSNIMSGFGIAAENSAEVADILAAASSRANTDVSQLGTAMAYVGPVAKAMGVSMSDTAAAVGVLSDAGIQGSAAGTGLRRVISSLSKPTKAATTALASLGLTASQVNPATKSLTEIVDALSGAGLDAARALEIFGDRGGPAILSLVENNAKLTQLTGSLRDVNGEAKRMADTFRDTLMGDVANLNSAFEDLQITIGDIFNSQARTSLQGLTSAIQSIAANMDSVINVVQLLSVAIGARLAVAVTAAAVAMAQKTIAATAATRTVNAYTGAVTTTTRATNIMTAAVTAGGRALSLLGGPAGILLMAAATFATYIAQTREADEESKKLADTTDILAASIEGLSAAQAKASRVDVLKAIEEQTAEFLRLRDAAESMERTLDMHGSSNMLGVTEERLLKVRGELDTTGQSVQKLYDRLQALDDVIAGSKPRQIEEEEAPPRRQIDDFGNIGDPFEKTAFDRQAEQLKMGTQQLQRELETRRSISQLYRDADIEAMQNQFAQQRALAEIAEQERLLTEEAKYLTDQEMRVARFEEMLERETFEAEQVAELRRLFEEQEAARLAAFEEQKTAIAEEGATARAKIDHDEKMARIGTWESMSNAGLQILGAFSSNSFKATKVLGIAESGISIVSGVAKALNNPYPANLGFAAQVAAQGEALISKLKSTNLSSGGGAPQISASAPSAPPTPQQPENMRPQEVNRAVVDLRGVSEDQWYKGDKIVGLVKELNKYMGDGNAVIRTEDR